MEQRIQHFLDGAISVTAIFLTAYFCISFTRLSTAESVAASAGLAFAGGALCRGCTAPRKKTADYDKFLPLYIYSTPSENARLFFGALSKRYDCSLKGAFIDFGAFELIFLLRPDAMTANQAAALSSSRTKPTVAVVSDAKKEALAHAKAAGDKLHIVEFRKFAPLLDKQGFFPPPERKTAAMRLSQFADCAFRRRNAKRFFSSAGLLLALSVMSGFSVWFLAFSALSAAFGIISAARGKREKS